MKQKSSRYVQKLTTGLSKRAAMWYAYVQWVSLNVKNLFEGIAIAVFLYLGKVIRSLNQVEDLNLDLTPELRSQKVFEIFIEY